MSPRPETPFSRLQSGLQGTALAIMLTLALGLVLCSALALAGLLPWLQVEARFGAAPVPEAGMILQLGLTALLLLLCFFLPANARMLRLERSHRSFLLNMEDVARAYAIAHKADREGVFALSSEFDSVRERIQHLRRHPDLGTLEPELLELAGQMSHVSRDLARVYSDEAVTRAKGFLQQRQEEAAALVEKVKLAQYACDELKRWLGDVEAEERQAAAQIERLERDLRAVLPALGYDFEDVQPNVVHMPAKPGK